ncbi:hypothetical protein K435DRAFT_871766 [Dendrothele bispora CBS 962.96]|uniref:Uncharacterized protein n=1 Tax=Dendrothele bispora (strain CBS 962.96) TaxID=1314807 RepID=A0A4V4HCE0_DENBC|nr:hypothetical protein K435DRAFT_871766 [Dendrothele bispora CBS 962.96]
MTRQSNIQSLRDVWSALYWTIQRPDRRNRWEDVGGQIHALTAEATIATMTPSPLPAIMRKIVAGEGDQLGDLSTVAEPSVVDQIKGKVAESQ